MPTEYDVSGNMPVATGASLLLHLVVTIVISATLINSAVSYESSAVTVTLTRSDQAPPDSQHLASDNQLARPGEVSETLSKERAVATLAMMTAETLKNISPSEIAAEVERLQGDVSQAQQEQSQNMRLGSVAARRALDAEYLRQWVRRVEVMGNAALNNVGSARGDVRLLVLVDQFGILLNVEVLESSGFPHLDRAAVKTVQDAAPYPAFPPALSAQVDKLEIVRTWQFRP